MLVGGIIGKILFAIPLVVICVIFASLIESFLVLPGHLRATMTKIDRKKRSKLRMALDNGFEFIRESVFRPLVTAAVNRPNHCFMRDGRAHSLGQFNHRQTHCV